MWIQLLRYEFYVSLSCFLLWIEEPYAWLRFYGFWFELLSLMINGVGLSVFDVLGP